MTAALSLTVDALREEEYGAAGLLIDRAMRPGGGMSMAEDFPLLVGPCSRSTRLVVRDGRRLVAHGAYLVHEIVDAAGTNRLRLGNVGAVCVAPEERGRGLGRRIVEALLEHADEEGLDGVILWTDKPEFYARFGFTPAGEERCFRVSRDVLEGVGATAAREVRPEDVLRLLEIRRKDPLWVRRSFGEARMLFSLPGSVGLVAPVEGLPEAYLVVGKGLDFPGTIAEWGGPAETVRAMLAWVFREGMAERLDILGPAWDLAYRRAFAEVRAPEVRRPLALVRPCGPSDLTRWLAEAPFYIWGLDSN